MSVTSIMSMASPSSAQSCLHENNSPNKDENELQESCQSDDTPTMLAQLEEKYGDELFTIAETK